MEVAAADSQAKRRLSRMLSMNVSTLEHLLADNRRDFLIAASRTTALDRRQAAWKRIKRRRRKGVLLVEELGVRTSVLEPRVRELTEIGSLMSRLKSSLEKAQKRHGPREAAPPGELTDLRRQLHRLMRRAGESCTTLSRRVERLRAWKSRHDERNESCVKGISDWWCPSSSVMPDEVFPFLI